jgi:hypothetical protein
MNEISGKIDGRGIRSQDELRAQAHELIKLTYTSQGQAMLKDLQLKIPNLKSFELYHVLIGSTEKSRQSMPFDTDNQDIAHFIQELAVAEIQEDF